jgi:hypothetical protein
MMIVIIIMTLCVWVVRYIRLSHVQSLLVLNAHEKSGRQHVQRRRARAVPASDVEVHTEVVVHLFSHLPHHPSILPLSLRLYKYEREAAAAAASGVFCSSKPIEAKSHFYFPSTSTSSSSSHAPKPKSFFFFFFFFYF